MTFWKLLAAMTGLRLYAGTFVTAGASAPSVIFGKGFEISAPSTGQYTITLGQSVESFVAVIPKIGGATASNDDVVEIHASRNVNNAGKASLVLETQSAAGVAGNLTGPTVNFLVLVRVAGATGDKPS